MLPHNSPLQTSWVSSPAIMTPPVLCPQVEILGSSPFFPVAPSLDSTHLATVVSFLRCSYLCLNVISFYGFARPLPPLLGELGLFPTVTLETSVRQISLRCSLNRGTPSPARSSEPVLDCERLRDQGKGATAGQEQSLGGGEFRGEHSPGALFFPFPPKSKK